MRDEFERAARKQALTEGEEAFTAWQSMLRPRQTPSSHDAFLSGYLRAVGFGDWYNPNFDRAIAQTEAGKP